MEEAEKPLLAYRSLDELFSRSLKQGLRPIGQEPVHPADSQLTQWGRIPIEVTGQELIQAKGHNYSLEKFLGSVDAQPYCGGHFLTYYLCPTDYHRVHSPVSGEITRFHYVPGQLWPVNNWSVRNIKDVFAINERVIIEIKTSQGLMALVMVGATNVGKMTLTFHQGLSTYDLHKSGQRDVQYADGENQVKVGDEVGAFHFGSTVVLLYSQKYGAVGPIQGGAVKVGESL